jgi:hypothetical protein
MEYSHDQGSAYWSIVMARLKEAWSFAITPLKKKLLRVLDLSEWKKKTLGF